MTEPNPEILPDAENQELLLDALERVLESNAFAEVLRLRKFLSYSVHQTIEGHGDRLKGFVIACEVFEKKDPSDAQTTTVVRVEAGRLRRRLKDYYEIEGKNDPIRISIPKGGYAASFSATKSTRGLESKPDLSGITRPIHHKPVVWIAALALLIFLYFQPWTQEPDARDDLVGLPGVIPAIAVMPFDSLTGENDGESFALGLTEDVLIDLSSIPSLDVISISSVLQYEGLDLSPREIGAQLGVGYVLEGNVRQLLPELLVSAHLIDTETGLQLWAERFESPAGNGLDLQEELARKVVSSLTSSLPERYTERFGQRYTQNIQAWFLYKQAMNLANPPSDPARLELALQAFGQVIEMDPEFAGGYAGSAYIEAFLVFFGHSLELEADRQVVLELAAKARQIDPEFGLTYSALAFNHLSQREFDQALAMSTRAVSIQPNDPYLSVYNGFILAAGGNLQEGIKYAKRALKLDPLNARTPYLNIIGVLNYFAGNHEDALEAFLKNQQRGGPSGPGQLQFLAAVYSKLGDFAMAESTMKRSENLNSEIGRSENWLLKSFRDPTIPQLLIDEIEVIRTRAELQD